MGWECLDCGSPYRKDIIEYRLIDLIQRKSAQYQIQDLRCAKSNLVQTRSLAKQSNSSAELKLDISMEEFLSQLKILRSVAEYHELDWLLEIVTDYLNIF